MKKKRSGFVGEQTQIPWCCKERLSSAEKVNTFGHGEKVDRHDSVDTVDI